VSLASRELYTPKLPVFQTFTTADALIHRPAQVYARGIVTATTTSLGIALLVLALFVLLALLS
jgi:hypothetical protein